MAKFTEVLKTLDGKKLKAAITLLNGLETNTQGKIKIVAVKLETLVDNFSDTVDALNAESIELPEPVVDMFNAIWDGTTDDRKKIKAAPAAKKKVVPAAKKKVVPAKKEPATPAAKKTPAEKKAPAEKKDSTKEKDEYGFTVGTRASCFIESIKKKAKKMSEVKVEPWNKAGKTLYTIFNQLREAGLMAKDDTTKIISFTGKK